MIKFFAPLICDSRELTRSKDDNYVVSNKLSLGRVAFWIVLIVCLYHYSTLSVNWLTVIMFLLAYNLGSKTKYVKEGSND